MAAAAGSVTSGQNLSSLLDAPLDKMMTDPWAMPPARPPIAAAAMGDLPASSQSDITWSSRRSPSPGL